MTTTIAAGELLDFGLCTGQCLLGQERECICRCHGRWHGALIDAPIVIPADLTLAEALSGAAPARHPKRHRNVGRVHLEGAALTILAREPGISGAELGRAIGASPRTGQRLLGRLKEAA